MDAYFDSAIIVKLYVQEATSPQAIRLALSCSAPYVLTEWQALEVRNAIRLKAFRREITSEEMNLSLAAFADDQASGRWHRPAYVTAVVEQRAEELSQAHSQSLGCRTLDIMHVAAAHVIGVREFVTFDERQATLARQAGMVVKP